MSLLRLWCGHCVAPTVRTTGPDRRPIRTTYRQSQASSQSHLAAPAPRYISIVVCRSFEDFKAPIGVEQASSDVDAAVQAVNAARSIVDVLDVLQTYLSSQHQQQPTHEHIKQQDHASHIHQQSHTHQHNTPTNTTTEPTSSDQHSSITTTNTIQDSHPHRQSHIHPPPSPSTPQSPPTQHQHATTSSTSPSLPLQLCIITTITLAKLLHKQHHLPERHTPTFHTIITITASSAAAHRHQLTPQTLPWALFLLASLRSHTSLTLPPHLHHPAQQLAQAALPLLQQLNPDGTSRLLWSLGQLQLQPPEPWMAAAVGHVHLHMQRYSHEHMLRVLEALAELQYCPSLPLLHDLVCHLQNSIARMRPGQVATLTAALSTLRYSPKRAWLKELLVKSRSKLSGCTAAELAAISAALQRMGCVPDPYWAEAFLSASATRMTTCDGSQLAQLLYSASTCKMDPSEGWVDSCLRMARKGEQPLDPLCYAQMLYGCMTLRSHKVVRLHVPWLARMTKQLQPAQLQQLPPRHLAELLISMAHFRAIPSPAWLQHYQHAAQQQLPAYSASDLAVTLAAASQLKLRAMELVLTTGWLLALTQAVRARLTVASQDELAMAVAGLATIQVCQKAAGQDLAAELEVLVQGVCAVMARWGLPQLARFNRELQQYSKSAFPPWYQQLAQQCRRLMVSKA